MTTEKRTPGKLPSPGPFLAEITNHLDPTFMGGLEVVLVQSVTNYFAARQKSTIGGVYNVKYLSPFSGSTSIRWEGNNPISFDDVQKSYGFFMVPPDIGTVGMVIFIDGDPNEGYWIGCVQDVFQNHMIPGIAASEFAGAPPELIRKYETSYLPVAEFLKKGIQGREFNPNLAEKPVHPFAERLFLQGLIKDNIRGVTSSNARRERPSGVYGISTPGPLDPDGPKKLIGYQGDNRAPVSRLGGSTFVMDDGDINGENELIRIRTRTGHQILLHNSEDLIYIANSKGTAWIEMTANGKIDIYAQDSVSIRSEKDFNLLAQGDINIEAGGDLSLKSGKNLNLESKDDFKLYVDGDGFLTVNFNLEVNTAISNKFTAGLNTEIRSGGNHYETANQIHMNGPVADTARKVTAIPTNTLPDIIVATSDPQASFSARFKDGVLNSIVKRAPTHEPYKQHGD